LSGWNFGEQNLLLSHPRATMLTQSEFEALLDRYLAGTSSPSEQQVVEHWYQQLGRDEPLPLNEAEQHASREAIWARIASQLGAEEKPALPASDLQ
jgi:hypothetical protein